MPNNIVFNPVAEQLKTLIHGMQGTTPTPLLLDSTTGKLLSTVDGSVTVAGTVTAQGTLTVTASNLDIRPLTASTDSFTLGSRTFLEDSTTIAGVTGTGAVLMENTGDKSMYSYYITNTGTNTITVKLQISPTTTDTYFVDDTTSINLAGGSITVLTAVKFLQYTRSKGWCNADYYYTAIVKGYGFRIRISNKQQRE
ncbi:DUF6385 domain-containing protein [Thermoanaerobacterium thermosaccharolyticum]|uniref:DUF6385 domain-containing protein n=1 Tax=Thermoanaerobacterium thermosaccharolyticum TaxID=1517 RepID=UPI0020A2D548|nr:DUF6385 domain-containing protein [Thermoanaerobacterium thermosaccharolyticum]MCP2241226.1 hypothetical protein [Thermoanaerobacterium thermosaccharolyticum]